jgi:hypothetical protein
LNTGLDLRQVEVTVKNPPARRALEDKKGVDLHWQSPKTTKYTPTDHRARFFCPYAPTAAHQEEAQVSFELLAEQIDGIT